MEGNGQFRGLVVDLNQLNQLRRDWEAAFTLQLQNGRSSEQLQQLLHRQFTFLENVVLNLSKQCHSLQEQVVAEKSGNDRLVQSINASRTETTDLVSKLLRRIEDLERSQSSHQASISEMKSEIGSLNSKIGAQQSQIKALEDILNLQGSAIQTTITNQADIKNEEAVNISNLNNAVNGELESIKRMLEEERQARIDDKMKIQESVSAANAMSSKQNEITISNLSLDVNSLATKLERQFSMIRQEQSTVLSVIKTISGSISNLRKEMHTFDSRQNVKIDLAKQVLLQQLKSEIKSVSRPLIIS